MNFLKKLFMTSCLALFPVMGFVIVAADITGYSAAGFSEHLDNKIPALMSKYSIPGAIIAVVKNGELSFTRAYGFANIETGQKMSTGHCCRVESISKSVTAWGVMKLVEQGRVNLDTPVTMYLKSWKFPESQYSTDKITVRQLLNHTSGLPLGEIGVRYSPTDRMPSLRESLTKNARPFCNPGLRFSYSNVGYHILELMIEDVTGMSFAGYMKQEILQPLGMSDSGFEWQDSFSDKTPNGYDFKGNPVPPYVYPEKASGGLIATVEDIAKFVCAGMMSSCVKENVLSSENIMRLYTPSVNRLGFYCFAFDSYGFGHLIEKLPGGKVAVAHGGQGTGWMTHFHSVPATGDGIVILTNSQRSWPFFAKVLTLWAQWNGFKRVGMTVITVSEKILWIIVGLLILIASGMLLKIVKGIISHTRRFSPFSRVNFKSRIVLTILVLSISAIYIWALSRDYIFFTSIFPRIAGWLVFLTPVMVIAMLFVVMFPESEQ